MSVVDPSAYILLISLSILKNQFLSHKGILKKMTVVAEPKNMLQNQKFNPLLINVDGLPIFNNSTNKSPYGLF